MLQILICRFLVTLLVPTLISFRVQQIHIIRCNLLHFLQSQPRDIYYQVLDTYRALLYVTRLFFSRYNKTWHARNDKFVVSAFFVSGGVWAVSYSFWLKCNGENSSLPIACNSPSCSSYFLFEFSKKYYVKFVTFRTASASYFFVVKFLTSLADCNNTVCFSTLLRQKLTCEKRQLCCGSLIWPSRVYWQSRIHLDLSPICRRYSCADFWQFFKFQLTFPFRVEYKWSAINAKNSYMSQSQPHIAHHHEDMNIYLSRTVHHVVFVYVTRNCHAFVTDWKSQPGAGSKWI